MSARIGLRTAWLRKSIREVCLTLGLGNASFMEQFGDGVFTLTVSTLTTVFTLRDAEPIHGEEWTLELARNYLLTCIRASLMQQAYGPPRVCVDGATGNTLVNNAASWEL